MHLTKQQILRILNRYDDGDEVSEFSLNDFYFNQDGSRKSNDQIESDYRTTNDDWSGLQGSN